MKLLLPIIFLLCYSNFSFSQSCTEETILYPDVSSDDASFGWDMELEGDRILAGAVNGGNNEEGLAYVFDYDGTDWNETLVMASDGETNDYFGNSVALDGDRIVVGAVRDDGYAGSVYVYDYDGTDWIETQKLTASDADDGDMFGQSVAIDGDRIAVGAWLTNSPAGSDTGNVYIFDFDGTSWNQTAILSASDAQSFGYLGRSVDMQGDRVVAGGGNFGDGHVYVYDYDGTNWNETILMAFDGEEDDELGLGIALGTDIIIAGAYGDTNSNGFLAGAAYCFEYNGTDWIQTEKFIAGMYGGAGNRYGIDVDFIEGKILVGAPHNNENGNLAGAVYLYEWDGSNWVETVYFSSGIEPNDHFGTAVAIDDANGTRIVASSPYKDINFDGDGEVYIFECCSNVFYADSDGDSYGDVSSSIMYCTPPSGYVTDATDCDDSDATIFPGNPEFCDGKDNDCNGIIDDITIRYFLDADGDGFGDSNISLLFTDCNIPNDYVLDDTDCDDSDPDNFPGNLEECDGQDNNCDGIIDEGCVPLPPCDGINLIIPTITQDTSRALIDIESDAIVNGTNSILFTSGQEILLDLNFEVLVGTTFEAKIEDCDNN